MAIPDNARKILDYWFGDLDHTPEYFRGRGRLWFMGGDSVDSFIRREFETDVIRAAGGELSEWRKSPKGALALIVLLDQFPLNLYREQARGYELGQLAIPLSLKAIESGWHQTLSPAEKIFLYMPLEHSESLAHQEQSVALFTRLAEESPPELSAAMQGNLDYAVRHWKVVKRFGRFPHRNAALRRPSSPEELEFLASSEAPF